MGIDWLTIEEDSKMPETVVCTYEGCSLEFSSASAMSKHKKKVHGGGAKKDESEKTIKCGKCEKYFKKASYVRMHEKRVHNRDDTGDNLDISVSIDEKLNNLNSSLNSTLALEENAGDISDIATADETITDESFLHNEEENPCEKNSLQIKNGNNSLKEKTFKCSKCDKMFGKKSYVRLHEKRIHKEKEPRSSEEYVNDKLLTEDASDVNNIEIKEARTKNTTETENIGKGTLEEAPQVAEPIYELPVIAGSSKSNNPVFNIYESSLYTSEHPMSRVSVHRKEDDFKCTLCGLKFLSKRSQVKHFKGHGTFVNQDFLTNFIDKENESSVKNMCLRKSSVSLKLPNIENFHIPANAEMKTAREVDSVSNMLEEHDEAEVGKMSLSEICDDLMDIGVLLS